MSQKKVDRYKQEKAHRKEQLAKEKRRQKITRIVLWAILAVFVLWIAYSVYLNVRPEPSAQESVPVETETAASEAAAESVTSETAAETETAASETAEAEGAEPQATSEAVSEESSAPEAEGTQDTAGEASETVAEPQAASSQEE